MIRKKKKNAKKLQVITKTKNRFQKYDMIQGYDHDRKLTKTSEMEMLQVVMKATVRSTGCEEHTEL